MASYGGPPRPIKAPTPDQSEPPQPSDGNQRKDEKCRKTEVVRVYDEEGKYWVDVEVLKNASFLGGQWKMPDGGNQSQQTISQLVRNLTSDGQCGSVLSVGMDPDKPITGGGNEGGPEAKVPTRLSSKFESRNSVVRKFSATRKDLSCCKGMMRRVKFNELKEEFLDDKGKSGTGKVPSAPADYRKAIKASDDGADFYVDICISKEAEYDRASKHRRVKTTHKDIWKNGNIPLPGGSEKPNPKGPFLRLDPYQVPINFGPDAIAVEFFDAEGPAVEEPKK